MIQSTRGTMSDHTLLARTLTHKRHQPVSREEEVQLFTRLHAGDPRAANRLVECNLRFVASVARKYQGRGLTLGELIAEGSIGLRDAVDRFDTSRDMRFISYGVWWIRQRILLALAGQTKAYAMPARFLEFASQVDRVQAKLEQSLGRPATVCELAEAMKTKVRTLEASLGILRSTVSLSATQDQDDEAPITRLVSPDTADGDTISRLNRERVRNALRTLQPKDREIVTRMFGLNGHPPETLAQVATRLGITSEYVRQRKNAALQSLKFIFKKHPL